MSVLSKLLSNPVLYLSELGSSQFAAAVLMAQERNAEVDNTDTAPMPYFLCVPTSNTEGVGVEVFNANVAVYPLQDIVSKYGTWWSMGSEYLLQQMRTNDQNPDVIAHVIDINSPGGEAYYTGLFAHGIRNDITKPILTHYNGMCCSAAYYLAAATDGIYASEDTDIVGSIGTMMTIYDFKAAFEKMGIKIHEVYADQSSEKNQVSIKAKQGNYEPIKQEILNPFAEAFISSVKKYRPSMIDDDKVFAGATYTAAEAQKIGLIDGVMTLENVVALAAKMGAKNQKSLSTSKKSNMSFLKKLVSGFGEDEQAAITVATQLDTLTAQNAALSATNAQLTADMAALAASAQDDTAQINALTAQVNALETERNTAVAELAAEKVKPRVGAIAAPIASSEVQTEVPENLRKAGAVLEAFM
jgi:protease-4